DSTVSIATVYLFSGVVTSYVVLIVSYNGFTIISSNGDFLDNWFIEKVENGQLHIIKRVGSNASQIICSMSSVNFLSKLGFVSTFGEKTSLKNFQTIDILSVNQIKKLGSDNSKVLLGGGGEMNVSDLIKTKYL